MTTSFSDFGFKNNPTLSPIDPLMPNEVRDSPMSIAAPYTGSMDSTVDVPSSLDDPTYFGEVGLIGSYRSNDYPDSVNKNHDGRGRLVSNFPPVTLSAEEKARQQAAREQKAQELAERRAQEQAAREQKAQELAERRAQEQADRKQEQAEREQREQREKREVTQKPQQTASDTSAELTKSKEENKEAASRLAKLLGNQYGAEHFNAEPTTTSNNTPNPMERVWTRLRTVKDKLEKVASDVSVNLQQTVGKVQNQVAGSNKPTTSSQENFSNNTRTTYKRPKVLKKINENFSNNKITPQLKKSNFGFSQIMVSCSLIIFLVCVLLFINVSK